MILETWQLLKRQYINSMVVRFISGVKQKKVFGCMLMRMMHRENYLALKRVMINLNLHTKQHYQQCLNLPRCGFQFRPMINFKTSQSTALRFRASIKYLQMKSLVIKFYTLNLNQKTVEKRCCSTLMLIGKKKQYMLIQQHPNFF